MSQAQKDELIGNFPSLKNIDSMIAILKTDKANPNLGNARIDIPHVDENEPYDTARPIKSAADINKAQVVIDRASRAFADVTNVRANQMAASELTFQTPPNHRIKPDGSRLYDTK
jgi:hypothetical protein